MFYVFDSVISWLSNPWNLLSISMSAIAFIGTVINAERNKWGFVFWIVSNTYMCIKLFIMGSYPESLLFFAYFILAIRGIFAWTKKETKEEKAKENC